MEHHAEKALLREHHGIGRIETYRGSWVQMVTVATQTNKNQNMKYAYENYNHNPQLGDRV